MRTIVSWLARQTAPGDERLVLKVNQKGSTTYALTFSNSDLVEAIYYAVNSGADVINLSLVLSGEVAAVKTAIKMGICPDEKRKSACSDFLGEHVYFELNF